MISYKRALKNFAKSYKMDSDELLISLWDFYGKKFDYLRNENDLIKDKDVKYVKQLISKKLKEKKSLKPAKDIPAVSVKVIEKDHDFSSVGKVVTDIVHIEKEEVLKIYDELVTDFDSLEDPIQPSGIKDNDLLDSAIFHGRTSYESYVKYPTVESAAAALMYAITHNHAFHNGNKRTAMVTMLVFLERHHISLTCSEDDLFKISLKLADHKLVDSFNLYPDAEINALAHWIRDNSKVIKKGERPITLKKLRQILDHFDCSIMDNGKVQRIIKIGGLFGYTRNRILISKRTIGDTISDGQEIAKGLIKSIREDLELTPDNNIDSETFYERDMFTSSDFIIKYKTLIKRLSKV